MFLSRNRNKLQKKWWDVEQLWQTQNAVEKWLNHMPTCIQFANRTVKRAFASNTLLILLLRKKASQWNYDCFFISNCFLWAIFVRKCSKIQITKLNNLKAMQTKEIHPFSIRLFVICQWMSTIFGHCFLSFNNADWCPSYKCKFIKKTETDMISFEFLI